MLRLMEVLLHGLLERDGHRYCYRLREKGKRVAAMFVLFHKRICGPLANSRFDHRPQTRADRPHKRSLRF